MFQARRITPLPYPPPHKNLEQSCAYLKHLQRRTKRNIEAQSEQSDLKGTTAPRVTQLCRRSHNYVRSCSRERSGRGKLSKMTICPLSFNFKSAFDRFSHKHLRYTLEQYGSTINLLSSLGTLHNSFFTISDLWAFLRCISHKISVRH
jgi:hypothetical protein